ncbi:MAG: hypothetical protein V3V60_11620 [Sphingomonas aquatilis]|jgi:hypothetical protein|uniref:hypothetical protein n=1 Tax=Sphingomonas aquatilis TaxID=93063 RepID=UPI002F2F29AC
MIADFDTSSFPAFARSIRAQWAPVFLTPIRGSEERLVVGIAVLSDSGFHIEPANALTRLQCLYGAQADIVIQVAANALDEMRYDLSARHAEALLDFRPTITGVSLGSVRVAEGVSLQSIGQAWMSALSSLYDADAVTVALEADDPEATYEERFEALTSGDRLPVLVLDYVVGERAGLAGFFKSDLGKRPRRRRSHEVSIDFTGSKLVANFGTLQVGQISRSVDLIKRRLWDLKVERDSETAEVFRRSHEMLIQMPAPNDPQVSERQYENLDVAKKALEEQANQEELRLEAFTSVAAIGQRVLLSEQA